MLAESAAGVLERMFFTSPLEEIEGAEMQTGCVSASLSFRGNPPGRFGVRVPTVTARKFAASFLGQEEETLTELQTNEVVCELANMICGSVLSRLEQDTQFELSQPMVEAGAVPSRKPSTSKRTFLLDEGALAIWLDLEKTG